MARSKSFTDFDNRSAHPRGLRWFAKPGNPENYAGKIEGYGRDEE
jgi:hypothetical protein